MPALNFQKKFAPLVESGEKTQTIRAVRKRPIREYDLLILYTGMRTRDCRKIGEGVVVTAKPIKILEGGNVVMDGFPDTPINVEALARDDGFDSVVDFVEFFRKQYGLPFEGVLIGWDPVGSRQ